MTLIVIDVRGPGLGTRDGHVDALDVESFGCLIPNAHLADRVRLNPGDEAAETDVDVTKVIQTLKILQYFVHLVGKRLKQSPVHGSLTCISLLNGVRCISTKFVLRADETTF